MNFLVPEKFEQAQQMLAVDCVYIYGNEQLTGGSIIRAFENNHINAAKKLDSIKYIDGKIDTINGNNITIIVQDKIRKGSKEYIYTDRLVISVNNSLVTKIEYKPFPEERSQLKAYLADVGVEL